MACCVAWHLILLLVRRELLSGWHESFDVLGAFVNHRSPLSVGTYSGLDNSRCRWPKGPCFHEYRGLTSSRALPEEEWAALCSGRSSLTALFKNEFQDWSVTTTYTVMACLRQWQSTHHVDFDLEIFRSNVQLFDSARVIDLFLYPCTLH